MCSYLFDLLIMKILTKGVVPLPEPPWWHGEEMICTNCGCCIIIEDGDEVSEQRERRPNGNIYATVKCPTCSDRISLIMRGKHLLITKGAAVTP